METNTTTNTSTDNTTSSLLLHGPFLPLTATTTFSLACILTVGIVGFFANTLLIMALCYSRKDRKSTANILIVNQIAIELCACLMVIVRYSIKLRSFYMTGWWGDWLCRLEENGLFQVTFLYGSVAGIVAITIERYFKVVHPIFHRNNGRNWMIVVGAVAPWIYGFILAFVSLSLPAKVVGGVCYGGVIGSTVGQQQAFLVFLTFAIYMAPMGIMGFCYSRILLAIKALNRIEQVRPSSIQVGGVSSEASKPSHMSTKEMNIVATMITQAALFGVLNTPTSVFFLVFGITGSNIVPYTNVRYVVQFLTYLNVCSNPLAYALKYRRVHASARRALAALRRKVQTTASQATVGIGSANSGE